MSETESGTGVSDFRGRTAWWIRAGNSDPDREHSYADRLAAARSRPQRSVAALRAELLSLQAKARRRWRGEATEHAVIVWQEIHRLALETEVACERGDPLAIRLRDAALALMSEWELSDIAEHLKGGPGVASLSADMLRAFLRERSGDRAEELLPRAMDALARFGGPHETRSPSEAIDEAVMGSGPAHGRSRRANSGNRSLSAAKRAERVEAALRWAFMDRPKPMTRSLKSVAEAMKIKGKRGANVSTLRRDLKFQEVRDVFVRLAFSDLLERES